MKEIYLVKFYGTAYGYFTTLKKAKAARKKVVDEEYDPIDYPQYGYDKKIWEDMCTEIETITLDEIIEG